MNFKRYLKYLANRIIRLIFGAINALLQNTTNTNNLGPDGYSWAQSYQPTIDQYGIIVTMVQINSSGLAWLVSNDDGATWTDITVSPGDGAYPVPVTRMSAAYDSINDKFHVIYQGTNSDDGMIYRRYSPIRNPDNTITGFTKDPNTNLQIDKTNGASPSYSHPSILFLDWLGANGTLVVTWGAKVGANVEIRSTRRELSNTSADGVLGNWTHLGVDSSDTIGNPPAVAYTAIMSGTTGVGGHSSVLIKTANTHIKDLYVVYEDKIGGLDVWRLRRAIWNGSTAWDALSTAVTIGQIKETGTDAGYSLKFEIGSKLAEDTINDLVYFGYSAWRNDTVGDTWQFLSIDTNDVASIPVPVYTSIAANNGATIFITGDIYFDTATSTLVVTYTDLPDKDTYIAAYKNNVLVSGPTLIFNTSPADIPVLVDRRINNQIVVFFRDFNVEARNNPPTYTPPYEGYWITIDV